MKLYLVRHGEAAPAAVDPERSLTLPGRRDVERVAVFLKEAEVSIPLIEHSGKNRARETAELIAAKLAPRDGVRERSGLGPVDPVQIVADEVAFREEDLMLVGHLPFLEVLASVLLTGGEHRDPVAFSPVTVACLERADSGLWSTQFVISPRLLG